MTININDTPINIYLQTGFFDHKDVSTPLHKHSFPEIHIVLNGSSDFEYDEIITKIEEGDVFLIPANKHHRYLSDSQPLKRISFLIDHETNINSMKVFKFPIAVGPLLSQEITEYLLSGNSSKLKALIIFVCSNFFHTKSDKKIPVIDRKFIINNFFAEKYRFNVTVDDLAKELCLSNKQTTREVEKYTGYNFRDYLSKKRIEVASLIIQSSNISLSEVSEMVGYSTYSGFYKAYKKYFLNAPYSQHFPNNKEKTD